MNFERIRLDFPILNKKHDFGSLVYLDSGATAQKPAQVINSVVNFYENFNSNVYRGVYQLGENATTMYEKARDKVASFINAADPSEIIFTGGTTEGLNFVADTWAAANISEGDEILLTEAEHHANFLPWKHLATKTGAKLRFIKIDKNSFKLLPEEGNLINEKTKLVSLIHFSNVLSNVWQENQLENLIKKAHQVGAKVLLDAAQSVPHKKIDIQSLNADFFVFSGHKMLGPTGIGVLFIKKELHGDVEPYQFGGSMVRSAVAPIPTWNDPPQKYEAGTPPIAQAIGLGAAVDYLKENVDFDELKTHEAKLCAKLVDGLQEMKGIHILADLGEIKKKGHLVSFWVDDIHVHDLAGFLGPKGISVRAGHHCAQPLSVAFNIQATLRVSFYLYNNEPDVDAFLRGLKSAIEFFKK